MLLSSVQLLQLFKKYSSLILLNLFLVAPNISFAATTDCIQTHNDGTYDCFKATSTWTLGGTNPQFKTFEELKATTVPILCNYPPGYTCYEQEELNVPPLPPGGCSSIPTYGYYRKLQTKNTQ